MTTQGTTSKSPRPPTKGPRVCAWIEKHCVYGEGDYFGQPVRLRPWQQAIIYRLYELRPDGRRRYRRALIGFPKGNGKTPLVSWVAAYELAGGEKISPVIPVSAASFEQADLAFGDLKTIFRESPTLSRVATVYDTEIVLRGIPGRAYRTAAARGSNDGARPTCYIADELHEFNDPAKEGAHLVLANGTAKRQDSLQLNVTTAGADLDSLLGRLYLKGKRILSGEEVDDTFLFIWFEAPDDIDITTPSELRRAIRLCNPAADDFLDVEEVASRFTAIPEFEFRRYYLNQWTRAAESWLPVGSWSACQGDAYIPDKAEIWVACDMALFHDSAAVAWAWNNGQKIVVNSKVWTVDKATGRIDFIEIREFLRKLSRTYNVQRYDGDPRFLEIMWQELLDEGLPMEDFPQSAERMVPACGNAYELIVNGDLVHGGDGTLTDHVLSAAQRPSDRGWTLSKGKSKRKIDACIALVMCTWAASKPEPLQAPGTLHFFN